MSGGFAPMAIGFPPVVATRTLSCASCIAALRCSIIAAAQSCCLFITASICSTWRLCSSVAMLPLGLASVRRESAVSVCASPLTSIW